MDITLFNFRTFWEANADEDYREDTIRMSIALMTFLKNNNLLVDIDPFNEDGSIKEDIIIRKSNVTDEGFQLFVKPVRTITPLSSAMAFSKCSTPRISICLLIKDFVRFGMYNTSITLRPRFLNNLLINCSAS